MAIKLTWDKSSSAYEAVEKAISKNRLYFNCDMLVRIMTNGILRIKSNKNMERRGKQ